MNDDLVTFNCDKCLTRLRVKPGLLKVMKTIKCSKCGHPIPVASVAPPVPAPEIPTPEPHIIPVKIEAEAPVESIAPPPEIPDRSKDDELESPRMKLRAVEQELAESDARIADLQELWHSKEIEIREMSARLQKAEEECSQARALRDDFLARAKNELAIYLVGERDSALHRFAELEKRLLALQPGVKTR